MTVGHVFGASMVAIGVVALARPDAGDAAGRARATPPAGCVARLRDVHVGSGAKTFASHYVSDGGFGYGEFVAGGFGGQSLWRERGGFWCRIPTGVAVLDRPTMTAFGVPPRTARRLRGKMKASGELAPPATPAPIGGPHR